MIFKKDEWEKIPLAERWKWENWKMQQSPVYWMNEYIESNVPSAEDVKGLVEHTKNVTGQLESLYSDMETLFTKYSVTDLESLDGYIQSLKDQVEALYQEKEEHLNSQHQN
jgi:hypothetical protein